MSRPFTVDDLLNVTQFTSHCPWDLSPDGGLLAVTLSRGKRRVPHDTSNSSQANGAYIVLIDVETGESMEPFSGLRNELGRAMVSRRTNACRIRRRTGCCTLV